MRGLQSRPKKEEHNAWTINILDTNSHLIEITLIEELLENVDQFGQGWKSLFEVLDQFHSTQAVGHVEADVDSNARQVIGQLDDRYLQ